MSLLTFMLVLFTNCNKGDYEESSSILERQIDPNIFLSKNTLQSIELVNTFYADAINDVKNSRKSPNSIEELYSIIEEKVEKQCVKQFGDNYLIIQKRIKSETELENIYSKQETIITPLSNYSMALYEEMNNDIDKLFDENDEPNNSCMQQSISSVLESYEILVANDENIPLEEKSQLISAMRSQIMSLPTIFAMVDIVASADANLSKGWLKKAWKKVRKFVGVVAGYTILGYVIGTEVGGIVGAVVGIGAAIACDKHGYDKFYCNPVSNLLKHTPPQK